LKSGKNEKLTLLELSIILVMIILFIGCEKSNDPNYNPPADHTISKSGFMHKNGLDQPLTNCVGCHGADLKGGTAGVSCFECHGTKW
jgi:cytochrome c553